MFSMFLDVPSSVFLSCEAKVYSVRLNKNEKKKRHKCVGVYCTYVLRKIKQHVARIFWELAICVFASTEV